MSNSSLYVIKKDYTGESICDYPNSSLFGQVIFTVLPDKYIPEFIKTPFGFKESIIHDRTGRLFALTNTKVNECGNIVDRICWELANQQIFFLKDKKIVSDSIRKFVEQNKTYDKSDDDGLSPLERDHIIKRFNEIADSILELDDTQYLYFAFKNTSCDNNVANWFYIYDKEDDEDPRYCSLKENIEAVNAEFVIIKNDKITDFIQAKDFISQT